MIINLCGVNQIDIRSTWYGAAEIRDATGGAPKASAQEAVREDIESCASLLGAP